MVDASKEKLDVAQAGLTPWKVIQTYSADEWEDFIVEWTDGFDPAYYQVTKLAGAGDKGRDVVAYVSDPQTDCEWDNYQCKHYDHALFPTDAYLELGKLCVYTHRGDFTVPRRYRFVCPRGVGVKLHDMMKHPDKLRKALIENWADHCENKISASESFPLSGDLKQYVNNFNFGIVWYLTPHDVLNQHRRTKCWYQRFKAELLTRPEMDPVPDDPQLHELVYISKLLGAYSDHAKQDISRVEDLQTLPDLQNHLRRSRGYFYSAEALARFSRDHLTPGAFEGVKQHVFDGVADVTVENHCDGLQCVLAVTRAAAILPLPQSDLNPYVGPADKKGICHHLANDDRLNWVQS